jgi:hypothetical protein
MLEKGSQPSLIRRLYVTYKALCNERNQNSVLGKTGCSFRFFSPLHSSLHNKYNTESTSCTKIGYCNKHFVLYNGQF